MFLSQMVQQARVDIYFLLRQWRKRAKVEPRMRPSQLERLDYAIKSVHVAIMKNYHGWWADGEYEMSDEDAA